MRQISKIAHNDRPLADILESHRGWENSKSGSRCANLQGANLRDANLQGANLRDANLQGANLRSANLQSANLRDADLFGANLQGANLRDANLQGANLRSANLQSANLRDADLFGANLRGADLRGAKSILVIGPGGSRGDMLYAVHGAEIMIKAGCFWGTLDEFEQVVQDKHGENQHGRYYQAAIQFIRAWNEEQKTHE